MAAREKHVPANQQDREAMLKALEEFLKSRGSDEGRVSQVDKEIEVRLSGKKRYIPAYTKSWMDENAQAPVMAITTVTDPASSTVYFWRAQKPTGSDRTLSFSDSMGGAHVAFGVPLAKLHLKFPAARRIVLPVHFDQLPTMGPVFSICFAEYVHEARHIDKQLAAAARLVETEVRKARKQARLQRTLSNLPNPSANA